MREEPIVDLKKFHPLLRDRKSIDFVDGTNIFHVHQTSRLIFPCRSFGHVERKRGHVRYITTPHERRI